MPRGEIADRRFLLPKVSRKEGFLEAHELTLLVSDFTGEGIDRLLDAVRAVLTAKQIEETLSLAFEDGKKRGDDLPPSG